MSRSMRSASGSESPFGMGNGMLAAAACVGLTVAFIDLSLSIVARPVALSSFTSVFPPLAVVTGGALIAFIAFWTLAAWPLSRMVGVGAATVALAVFSTSMAALLDYNRYSQFSHNPYKLFLLLLVAVTLGALASVAGRSGTDRGPRRRWLLSGLALPVVMGEVMVFQWFHHYHMRSFTSAASFMIMAVCGVVAMVTVIAFQRMRRTRTATRVIGVVLALVLASPLVTWLVQREARPASAGTQAVRHVILIVVDTLRPDCLSAYDEDAPPTPHIDALASDGVLFSNAISAAPWTLPAVTSILTGLSPTVHNVMERTSRLSAVVPTIANYMRDAGYVTGALVRNPVLAPERNLWSGFQSYVHFPTSNIDGSLGTSLLKRVFRERYRDDASTGDVSRLAGEWVKRNHDNSFFFYVHYYDPHGPYEPPKRFRPAGPPPEKIGWAFGSNKEIRAGTVVTTDDENEWIRQLYEGEVRYVDDAVGHLVDDLEKLGIYDESLIILTSDHGEEFWEHGSVAHGQSLYNELVRVPLIVKLPGSADVKSISTPVATQSITPTILDLCGVDFRREHFTVGSLSPLWKGESDRFDGPIFSTGVIFFEERESIVFDHMKYIRGILSGKEELYDLESDPGEQSSLTAQEPVKIEKARALLLEHEELAERLREVYEILGREGIELDDETIKRLKALGYM